MPRPPFKGKLLNPIDHTWPPMANSVPIDSFVHASLFAYLLSMSSAYLIWRESGIGRIILIKGAYIEEGQFHSWRAFSSSCLYSFIFTTNGSNIVWMLFTSDPLILPAFDHSQHSQTQRAPLLRQQLLWNLFVNETTSFFLWVWADDREYIRFLILSILFSMSSSCFLRVSSS